MRVPIYPGKNLLVAYWLNSELTNKNQFACPAPRNIACFTLKNGLPQINVINLVGAFFNGTPDDFKEPYIRYEPSLLYLLKNGDIKALHDAGIKVVLTVMGDAEVANGIGWSSIPSEKNEDFVKCVNNTILAESGGFSLDGIDIDDEYANSKHSTEQLIDTVKKMDEVFDRNKIISKALYNDWDVFKDKDIKNCLTYGCIMKYGNDADALKRLYNGYKNAGLSDSQLAIGVQPGPIKQPVGNNFTSIDATKILTQWQPEGGTKLGMMFWSFSQDIQQFTSYPQHEKPYISPNDNDHEWQKTIVETMWGADNWVVKEGCLKSLYVPSGSYLDSSKNIQITLSAKCKKKIVGTNFSTIDITDHPNTDVKNDDGVLTKTGDIVGQADIIRIEAIKKARGLGRFVPVGSFIETSEDIKLTLEAECCDKNTKYNHSSLDITDYNGYSDGTESVCVIENDDGKLVKREL